MAPLISIGEEINTTALIVSHTNKRKGAYGRDRIADSPTKSGVMIFFILVPARRSFFRSFFLTLSSVVRNITFTGSRFVPCGSSAKEPMAGTGSPTAQTCGTSPGLS